VDPWAPVERAVLTHAHADHARPGSGEYHTTIEGAGLARKRLGDAAVIHAHPYGEPFSLGDVRVSLHPAGHVRGSAQVRIEGDGGVWVVTGDVKRDPDPTCTPLEPLRCDVLVTEATFALPIFRFPDPSAEIERLLAIWDENAARHRTTLLGAYAVGKAPRLLAMLRGARERPIYTHGAIESVAEVYRREGVPLAETRCLTELDEAPDLGEALVLAPPAALRSPWTKRLDACSVALASGFMLLRGPRRRRLVEHGIVISDHADFATLLEIIDAASAKRVLVTHGYAPQLARLLRERGLDASTLETSFEGETEAES
jgi:putative mRNA 3-end processing factor